ncbi:phage adaptor protein [Variovorax sp. PMC12]|uniref:phage adaptor protein n=1 Tax=Variovorax sp. PMC12 TaxID=2126319 RepID=UPI000D13DCC1|nr:DUF6682 family protein [Variovorax sp. PMC12]AVQ84289.1 hypothetical protein C4F17_26930 [Variovorax sp. PMC12]
MTLQQLIRRFRVLARDTVAPYLWADEDVRDWFNDAQAQAAVRARLLLEDSLPAVCQIVMEAGRHTYPLHASLYELTNLHLVDAVPEPVELKLVSRGWLDREAPGWRVGEGVPAGELRYALQGDTTLRLVNTPTAAGTLFIEGYRLPLATMTANDDVPEIHKAHHEKLIQWPLHRAFSIPDSQAFDPNRAAIAEGEFTAYFGPMPDADMRRITREDTDQTTVVYPL